MKIPKPLTLLWNRLPTHRRRLSMLALTGLRRLKRRYAIPPQSYALRLRVLLIVWILLLQMQMKVIAKMPRMKKLPETTLETMDQDLIEPMETEPTIKTKRGRPKGATGTSGRSSSTKLDREVNAIEKSLGEAFALATLGSVAFSPVSETLANDCLIVADRGTKYLVPAIGALARENARLRAALLGLGESSAYIQLCVAVAAIAVPIAINHKYLPAAADRPFQMMDQMKDIDPSIIEMMLKNASSNGAEHSNA